MPVTHQRVIVSPLSFATDVALCCFLTGEDDGICLYTCAHTKQQKSAFLPYRASVELEEEGGAVWAGWIKKVGGGYIAGTRRRWWLDIAIAGREGRRKAWCRRGVSGRDRLL